MDKHSRWPTFMRMHGSILPNMVLPLFFIGCWASLMYILPPKYLLQVLDADIPAAPACPSSFTSSVSPTSFSRFLVSSFRWPSPSASQQPTRDTRKAGSTGRN